ncbi:unnamed protein product [Candidula unifasciata]|uniref:HAT C-terminal dimerisation domain-containing protein n=1 Tax=Candidula unifasciata TaxID=100452 RepID=A0A8S3YMB5_9EUPU|nr:unnamed protein product [Candidula unifasciata]
MLGKHQGVTARLSAVTPQMQSLHCLIHQNVLCSKLSNEMKETMDMVMKIINFIRSSSSLQHRLFRQLLEETEADYKDLLLHNDVRWLSKGKALDRFWSIKEEMICFLGNCSHNKAEKFRKVLPTITNRMIDLLKKLQDNFNNRFEDFSIPNNVMLFVRDPFKIPPAGDFSSNAKKLLPSVDEGSLQLELVDIQKSGTVKVWSETIQQEQFPNARKVTVFILTMFGSTFNCESSFSHMNIIKTNSRSSMSNDRLQDCMRIALTSHQPNFIKLAQKRKCNFSH